MSFILDALKKSETDRQRQSSPALFEVKVAAPRRRFPLWAIALGVLLGVNMLVLGWVLLRPASAPAPAVEAAPLAANAVNPTPAASAAPPGMMTVPATVTIPTTVNIPIGSAPAITVGPNEPGVIAPSSTPPLAEEPLLSRQEPSVPPDYDARDYQPAVTSAPSNNGGGRRPGSVPTRDEVLAQGTQLPELRLDLHVYATDPAQRFVFINMRKLREGEGLPDGVRVEQFTPTGALLTYRTTRFSLERN